MKTLLANSSVVLSANDVNLSIFRPDWLTKYGCLHEEEIQQDQVVVTPVFVKVPCKTFELTILPMRIQMAFSGPSPGMASEVDRVVGQIVRTLPHTPYSGCGLNFHYLATVEPETFKAWSGRLFASEAAKLAGLLEIENSRFGTYFSVDVLGGTLKADIKPTRTSEDISKISKDWEPDTEVMRWELNYHFEVPSGQDRDKPVLRALGQWDKAREDSQRIMASVEE